MAPMSDEEMRTPVMVDGALARLGSDGATTWAEVWKSGGWTRSEDLTVGEVMAGFPASAKRLAAFGVTSVPPNAPEKA